MGRIDYYHDPNAPTANSLVVGGSAVVFNNRGEILLQQRSDNSLWALPSGAMDIGETLAECVCRETVEETGITIEPVGIVGIYSDPNHVFAYDNGEVRQEFSICLRCKPTGGELTTSAESTQAAWFPPDHIDRLDMHPSIRLRIRHALEQPSQPYIG